MGNKALIIGNSKEERQRLASELAFEGFEIDETETGCEIINHTGIHKSYNIIICDWNLTILNPIELLSLAISKNIINDNAAIFICVDGSDADIYCLNLLNKVHILKKPINVSDVINFLKNDNNAYST